MVVADRRPTKITVSQSAIAHNLAVVRKQAQAEQVFFVVKANAYGYGILPMSQGAVAAGAEGLAVAVLDEALALREAGITLPILILGIVDVKYAKVMAQAGIIATVCTLAWLTEAEALLADSNDQLLVSLAVDTGMGRIGFRDRAPLLQAINYLQKQASHLVYHGLMTHFAESDTSTTAYFKEQVDHWHRLVDGIPQPPMVHVANSGAAMYHAAEIPTQTIRAGAVVYGMEPSEGVVRADDYLMPVITLESELVFVQQHPAGDGISYGHEYRTYAGEWIGTVPIGYGDGLSRNLQKGFTVLVDGFACPIVGQIAMDQLMVSLPKELPVGSRVTFIGENHGVKRTLTDMAQASNQSLWEVTIAFSERIKRSLVD
ncbi:alanine racemase [Weissella oryzae SG25]|uniref:Alanine racemase n=1 Tax=Weissella oryzae (strain DSM 25784 / JCM 18191 / LMG 30913 / SG25) TaxID=1329250 RepID=A0A069D2P0_WEIOS|nr:alanine racemase [Weissella oryzae]GAK31686.1 alanine racemase [Weissella oryzae SG25]